MVASALLQLMAPGGFYERALLGHDGMKFKTSGSTWLGPTVESDTKPIVALHWSKDGRSRCSPQPSNLLV